jgi:protocatechuate 3,4-dioxygenase beta subunit
MKKMIAGGLALTVLALPALAMAPKSGLQPGETVSAFHPNHISGPDKGTDTCPPCKYGNRPAVQVWVNHESADVMVPVIQHLNKRVAASKNEFKAFVINVASCAGCMDRANDYAKKANSPLVAIANLNADDEAVQAYKFRMNKDVTNTVIVYRNRKVVANFVNFKPTAANMKALDAAISKVDVK